MALLRATDGHHEVRRTSILNRLVTAARVDPMEAEQWIARRERQADTIGVRRESPTYWNAALRWIADQRGEQ